MHGAALVLLADALFLPTGVLTAAALSRMLGPEGYGVYSLAVTIGGWLEWTLLAGQARAAIKLIGGTRDWQPIASTALRFNTAAGFVGMFALMLAAGPVASFLNEPAVTSPLRAYGFTVVAVALTAVHSQILVGLGRFEQRAVVSASYAGMRMVLVVALVVLGFGPTGAVVGLAAASGLNVLVARRFVHPSFRRSSFPTSGLIDYAGPLFVFAVSTRALGYLDLVLLKWLGGTTEQAGYFGAAQTLAASLNAVLLSVSPLVLSSITRALRDRRDERSHYLVLTSLRFPLGMIPIVAIIAGAAGEVLTLVAGPQFSPAATLVPALAIGAVARGLLTLFTTMMTAAGQPRLPAWLVGPALPIVVAAHAIVIPIYGPLGAAVVTGASAVVITIAGAVMVHRQWRLTTLAPTLVRALLLSVPAYWLAATWSTPGLWLVAKLGVLGVGCVAAFALLGEFTRDDVAMVREAWSRRAQGVTSDQ